MNTKPAPKKKPICSIEGCEKEKRARGWCPKHYDRWWRYGDPLTLSGPATKSEPYTDAEIGYIEEHMDTLAPLLAQELGRSVGAINMAKQKIRKGILGRGIVQRWTADEIELLKSLGPDPTSREVAKHFPFRAPSSVGNKRIQILGKKGKSNPYYRNPLMAGDRRMLARTCSKCGLLLPGAWFYIGENKKRGPRTLTICKKCHSNTGTEYQRKTKSYLRADTYRKKAQKITEPLASNNGQPYTEKDHSILVREDMTNLGKALALKRTYQATCRAVGESGFSSLRALGDPYQERWIIDNPSAPEAVAITAAFKAAIDNGIIPAPEWDWDDEDLKETA